jgi:hypothetical protein
MFNSRINAKMQINKQTGDVFYENPAIALFQNDL